MLRWDAIDGNNEQILIQRVEGSESGIHPLQTDELEGGAIDGAGVSRVLEWLGRGAIRLCCCRFMPIC